MRARSISLQTWRKALDGLIEEPVPDGTVAIDVPTLVLWGTKDALLDAGTQSALAKGFSDLTAITYADVGHAPHWERPESVAKDIRTFVDRIAQSGGVRA